MKDGVGVRSLLFPKLVDAPKLDGKPKRLVFSPQRIIVVLFTRHSALGSRENLTTRPYRRRESEIRIVHSSAAHARIMRRLCRRIAFAARSQIWQTGRWVQFVHGVDGVANSARFIRWDRPERTIQCGCEGTEWRTAQSRTEVMQDRCRTR